MNERMKCVSNLSLIINSPASLLLHCVFIFQLIKYSVENDKPMQWSRRLNSVIIFLGIWEDSASSQWYFQTLSDVWLNVLWQGAFQSGISIVMFLTAWTHREWWTQPCPSLACRFLPPSPSSWSIVSGSLELSWRTPTTPAIPFSLFYLWKKI